MEYRNLAVRPRPRKVLFFISPDRTLTETLGVSKGTVAMWETGKRMPGFDMLVRLSELFDKRVDYIIGASEDRRSAALTEEEVALLGEWAVEEDYEDMLRKYACSMNTANLL